MKIKNNRGGGPGIPIWLLGVFLLCAYGIPAANVVLLMVAVYKKSKKLAIISGVLWILMISFYVWLTCLR